MHDLISDRNGVLAVVRRAPGKELVGHDPQRKQVGTAVDRFPRDLLGRHEHRRAEVADVLGQMRAGDARDPEIRELRHPVLGEEDIRGLDVPVDDSAGVGDVEGRPHLTDDLENPLARERLLLDQPVEARTRNELHDQVELAGDVVLPDVEDSYDVRVIEAASGLGLAKEALLNDPVLLRRQSARYVQQLDGDGPVDERVLGPVDDAHGAPTQGVADDVAPDPPLLLRGLALHQGPLDCRSGI